MSTPTPRKPLLCRLNMHHKWERRFYQNGDNYRHCTACGKETRTVRTGGNLPTDHHTHGSAGGGSG